ncbi:MAG: YajQ family cyclic di-GMP-binding protein [Pseudomonadota bacterium]
MPSFDIVSEVDKVEVRNSVDQAMKEVGNRFDFKGSSSRVEYAEKEITLFADTNFQIEQVFEILSMRLAKRNVDIRSFKRGDIQTISGNKVKQIIEVKEGIEGELAKKIVKLIKDSKLKVQAAIQGDTVRISGAKRDDLQDTIQYLKKNVTDTPLQFNNFRD